MLPCESVIVPNSKPPAKQRELIRMEQRANIKTNFFINSSWLPIYSITRYFTPVDLHLQFLYAIRPPYSPQDERFFFSLSQVRCYSCQGFRVFFGEVNGSQSKIFVVRSLHTFPVLLIFTVEYLPYFL